MIDEAEYRKLELLWKEACVARDDYKQQADAKDALWTGAIHRAESAESSLREAVGRARTAGAVEICSRCHRSKDGVIVHSSGFDSRRWGTCTSPDCPIKQALSPTGGADTAGQETP